MLSFPISSYFSCLYLLTFVLVHIVIISICPPILVADAPTPYSQTPICSPSYPSRLHLPILPCHAGLVAGRSSLVTWAQPSTLHSDYWTCCSLVTHCCLNAIYTPTCLALRGRRSLWPITPIPFIHVLPFFSPQSTLLCPYNNQPHPHAVHCIGPVTTDLQF
jgi:hypothetical protein